METNNERQQRAMQLFNLARLAGVAKTQKEFAYFLGINEQTISKALKGDEKYLTNNFFERIENAFNESGISLDGAQVFAPINNQQGANLHNQQTADPQPPTPTPPTDQTTDKLLAEMKAQREMYDRQFSELLRQNAQLLNIVSQQIPLK